MKRIMCKGGCGETTTHLSGYCPDCRKYAPKLKRRNRKGGRSVQDITGEVIQFDGLPDYRWNE